MKVISTNGFKIICRYDEMGLTLKNLLEDMYLVFIRGIKNG
ncbi:MAG: hypothetical protein RR294_07105 [Bacilli bacterium]